MENKLEFYGIGPTFRKRIKSFNIDISNAVINNGHLSKLFLLIRDKQGDQLYPYLFILGTS
jgi:hypothetical protein